MSDFDMDRFPIETISDSESVIDETNNSSITLIDSPFIPQADYQQDDEPNTPGASSLILDLTQEELDFINDIEHDSSNNNNNHATNGRQQVGSSMDNSISLDDDTYAFFVEAGLEDPEELKMLGIDVEEITRQKEIAERLEREQRRDYEAATQLQEQLERERYLPPSSSTSAAATTAQPSSSSTSLTAPPAQHALTRETSFMSQASIKRELDHIADDANRKRIKFEPTSNNNGPIELLDDDDDDDLVDLTSETEMMSAYNNQLNKRKMFEVADSSDDDQSTSSEIQDYLSNVPWNQRPHSGAPPPPFGPLGGDYEGTRDEPDFHLFNGDFGFHHYGSHIPSFGFGRNRETRLSFIPDRPLPQSSLQTEEELRSLLENVMYDEPPPPDQRAGTPEGLVCTLMEHQKIGLQWMLKMERSNNKGGILADDMGLGKTIQAMSVILENPCTDTTLIDHSRIKTRTTQVQGGGLLKIKATLIVCPVSLIDQWRREIESKTQPRLRVLVYHGGQRTQNPYDLAAFDVIVSSYAITAGNYQEQQPGVFSKVKFHRVILDEAHTIKNKATRAALGCCAVDATYRWCLTATPIQNKIEELYSLIKFLRIRPFCEWEEFRDCINKPMKNGNTKKALKVAHVLMKAISLRRSKKATIDGRPILNLPERNVHMTHIDFSPDERQHYDFVNQTAQAQFNKYMQAGTVMKNYSSVLVLLLRLRQACLHPSLTVQEGEVTEKEIEDRKKLAEKMKPEIIARLLDDKATLEEIECPICMDIAQNAQIIYGCGHILCKECFDGYWNTNDGNTKRCPTCRGEMDNKKLVTVESFLEVHAPNLLKAAQEEITPKEKEEIKLVQDFISSAKIDKMIEILNQTDIDTNGEDKTIIFSQFTGMLDLVEKPLKEHGHRFLRYDGSMDIKARAEAVRQFFDNPDIKVLLVSTKCGSLGLNLTIANRVIILDVWWNPALENQAIDRVHRIGQEKNVEVHRIFINDTVEDRILELQNKKQNIADGVLGEGTGAPVGRLGLQEMIYLFRGGEPPGSGAPANAPAAPAAPAGPPRAGGSAYATSYGANGGPSRAGPSTFRR